MLAIYEARVCLHRENSDSTPMVQETMRCWEEMRISKDVFRLVLHGCVFFHEHHEIDGHISNLALLIDRTFVGNDGTRKNMVIGVLQQVVEGAVYAVVLARRDLYRMSTHGLVVVDEKVYLALLAVIIIEKLVSVGTQFLCNNALIDGAEVDAADVIEHGSYVVAIERTGEQAHIVEVELQQVFLQRLANGEARI